MVKALALVSAVASLLLYGCSIGVNGTTVGASQAYFSPYTPTREDVAVVYIYWNQEDIDSYLLAGSVRPRWYTYVNRKKNAEIAEGSYSVVEVQPGRVNVEARIQFGIDSSDIIDRPATLNLTAKAGQFYYVSARIDQEVLGKQLQLKQEPNERQAYSYLYGLRYQRNLQKTLLY